MRAWLAFLLCGATVGCSTDDFATTTDSAVVDGAPSDAGAVPIAIVNKTSLVQVNQLDPVGQLSPLPSAGNAVVVAVVCFSEAANCSIPMTGGVTDNQGNTYRQAVEGNSIVSSGSHGTRGYLYVAENIGAPVGTFEIRIDPLGGPDANVQNFSWGALEVRGLAASDSVDATGKTAVGNGATTTVTTSAPTTRPTELALALHYARSQSDLAYVSEAGWTEIWSNPTATTSDPMSLVMRLTTATGSVSHTWQHGSPSRGAAAVVATFKGR